MSDRPAVPLGAALAALRGARRPGDVVITTMGAAREWLGLGPLDPCDLVFVPSSMSQATSVGLGLALAQPERRIVVVNGDGSMLMNLGSLVTIAAEAPANLLVIIADNGVYEVTGSQPTPGSRVPVDWIGIARGCGLGTVFRYWELDRWVSDLPGLLRTPGPVFIQLDVIPVPGGIGPRSPGPAGERARRLREALAG